MRYLLDTHTFAWAVSAPDQLSPKVQAILKNPSNGVLISAAVIWEMSIKHHLGKWPEVAPFLDEQQYAAILRMLGGEELPIRHTHARLAGQWQVAHRDPFDRLLVAQALLEGVPILSRDAVLDQFPIQRVW